MASLENDMACLIDSLQYMKDDLQQQVQALEHLADMCLQEHGSELFSKTNGLSIVFKLAFNKKSKPLVLQKALLCLGNASLTNDENKGILCSDQMLNQLQSFLLVNTQSIKIIASATYFLACLCTNNEKAQNKARKSKCLEKLINLYRHFHPKGDTKGSEVERWFEKANSNSPIVLNHISHALKAIINKPRNGDNQVLCSRLLNLAISSTLSTKQKESKINSLQFVADCLYENDKTQRIFHMIGGLRYLSRCLQQEKQNKTNDEDIYSALLDTVSVAVAENDMCKTSAAETSIVEQLLELLQTKISDMLMLKCLICLSELVHENNACQQKLLNSDGIPLIIGIMSKKQDDMTSKVGTSILQSCIKNLSDLSKQESEPEEAAEETQHQTAPTSTFSNILQFFSTEKNTKKNKKYEENVPKNKCEKNLKSVLRSLQLSTDQNNSEQIKELIKHIEDGTVPDKRLTKTNLRCADMEIKRICSGSNSQQSDERLEISQNDRKKKISASTVATKKNDIDMVKLLQEQKELMHKFQNDITNLRAEIAESQQASECGDAKDLKVDRVSISTPRRRILTASTPSRIPRPLFHCPNSVPTKRKHSSTVTPIKGRTIMTPMRNHQKQEISRINSTTSQSNVENSCLPLSNHHEIDVFDDSNEEETGNDIHFVRDSRNTTFFDDDIRQIDQSSSVQDDERPALRRGKNVLPLNRQNLSQHTSGSAEICNNSWSVPKPVFTAPSAFEKVERWRQSVSQHQSDVIDDAFKVPIVTPLMKRRRLEKHVKTPVMKIVEDNLTPECLNDDDDKYDKALEYAPKKVLITKRRRPLSPDEGYEDYQCTPELRADHWDRTKRTLNFDRFSRRQVTIQENEKKCSEKIDSSSSGFVDGSSRTTKTCSENVETKSSIVTGTTTNITTFSEKVCLGCQPFGRTPYLNMNSRNILSLLKGDRFTCFFHAIFAKRSSSFIALLKKEMKKQKNKRKRCFSPPSTNKFSGTLPMPINGVDQWESMSVFSFRSNNQPIKDDASDVSGWTVNTAKRRRRQEYSEDELNNIYNGIKRYGTRWSAILNSYTFKEGRTANDLRYKYKQLKKNNSNQSSVSSRRPVNVKKTPFTTEEIVNLRKGVQTYGEDWCDVLQNFYFQTHRTTQDLQNKWKMIMKKI